MIEIILIIGLLFVICVVGFLHFAATSNIDYVREASGFDADPTVHPWFVTIEAILLLCLTYIIQNMF